MTKKDKIILTNTFTRDLSVFFCVVWGRASQKHFKKYIGANRKNLLYLRENDLSPVKVWHDENESNWLKSLIVGKAEKDSGFCDLVVSEWKTGWASLSEYFLGKRKIKTIDELEQLSEIIENWIASMMVNFVIVDSKLKNCQILEIAEKYREKTQKYVYAADQLFVDFFKESYPEYQQIAEFITPEEAFSLKNRRLSDLKVKDISKRKNGYAIFNDEIMNLDELKERLKNNKIKLCKEKIDKSTKTIQGNIANKGKVIGIVKIVLIKKEFKKFKDGDILVAKMTTPDYLPIMKMASAFITDEGGIMCHAAIVSREMKKPCIIGTKIATQVLKDGDKVEVDADKGIVKIIT